MDGMWTDLNGWHYMWGGRSVNYSTYIGIKGGEHVLQGTSLLRQHVLEHLGGGLTILAVRR